MYTIHPDPTHQPMTQIYIARTLAGQTRRYHSYVALRRAKARRLDVIVESWREDDPPPFGRSNDAHAWSDYRLRHGCTD